MMVVQLEKKAELEIVYFETGRPNSSQNKQVRDHKKLIHFFKDSIDTMRSIIKLKKIFNQPSKRQNLTIFTINITDTNKLFLFFYIFINHSYSILSISRRCYRTLCYAKRIGYLQVLLNRRGNNSVAYRALIGFGNYRTVLIGFGIRTVSVY
jgi:hypothetical protein